MEINLNTRISLSVCLSVFVTLSLSLSLSLCLSVSLSVSLSLTLSLSISLLAFQFPSSRQFALSAFHFSSFTHYSPGLSGNFATTLSNNKYPVPNPIG